MRTTFKIIFILLLVALAGSFCRYIYRIGNAPEPHRSVNPYSVYNGTK